MNRTGVSIATVLVMVAAGCSGSDAPDGSGVSGTAITAPAAPSSSQSPGTAPTGPPPTEPTVADDATLAEIQTALDAGGPGCDPLDTTRCALPFPSDALRRDGRVAFPTGGVPANASGVSIDPSEWNRNDGFSTNAPLLTYIADLDADASALPPWTDLQRSFDPDAAVVLVDAATGLRVPLWAELDAKAASDDDRLLIIQPAAPLQHDTTYAVGLRGMVDMGGQAVEPGPVFRVYRDMVLTEIDEIEDRRPEMELAFTALNSTGVNREELQLAWTFTTASQDNITGRMEHIRNVALGELGAVTPTFAVTEVLTAGSPDLAEDVAVQVRGTFTVPNFLTGDGGPGQRFHYDTDPFTDPDALPSINPDAPTLQAPFLCAISTTTVAGAEPAHLVIYGHGLLGSEDQIRAGSIRDFAAEHNIVFCATKWAGMSADDIGNAAATLGDVSNFPTIADRLQQGVLNQIFLGRLMTGADGLVTVPEFQRTDGSPLIDTAHLDYDGNSQGAIMGLMLTAVSPDIERGVLGVAGMNYSVLLSRSVDFDTYEAVFKPAYPNDLDRVLIIALMQMLWDRGEGAGYTSVLDKPVLLHVALGDWQVSELTAMIEARAIGATIHRPVVADGRSDESEPGWDLETTTYPSTDGTSAIVVWDSGSDLIPFENVPPRTSRDPHGDPRADPAARKQKAAWLFEDTLIDVCSGGPCTAAPSD